MPIRAYARSRGVSHVAVPEASKAGRIALEPDASIDSAKADAAWDRSTDPGKAKGTAKPATKSTKPPAEAMKPVAEAAVGSVRETLKEQGLPASGSVTFVQARTAHEIAKAHLARLRLQRMKGEGNPIALAIAQRRFFVPCPLCAATSSGCGLSGCAARLECLPAPPITARRATQVRADRFTDTQRILSEQLVEQRADLRASAS